jgi:hypothetical protein
MNTGPTSKGGDMKIGFEMPPVGDLRLNLSHSQGLA